MLPYRMPRWVLGSLATVTAVAAVVLFFLHLADLDNRDYGPVYMGLALFACFTGLTALGLWAYAGIKTTIKTTVVEPSLAEPVKVVTPEPLHRKPSPKPRIVLIPPPGCDEPTITLDKPKGRSQVPRPRPVDPEWDYGRQTIQLSKVGVTIGAGADERVLADLMEIDTMAGETLCVNDESAVDPEAMEALRRIARKLRREEP